MIKDQSLTRTEATSLMVGAGIGAGIMAVPFLAEKVGFIGIALILPVAWTASSLVHLMLAEVLFRTGRDLQIVELMHLYVLRGRLGRWILWTIFAFLSIAFLANLAAYISGAGEIIANLIGINRRLAEILVYVISASVVFFGLKAKGSKLQGGTGKVSSDGWNNRFGYKSNDIATDFVAGSLAIVACPCEKCTVLRAG